MANRGLTTQQIAALGGAIGTYQCAYAHFVRMRLDVDFSGAFDIYASTLSLPKTVSLAGDGASKTYADTGVLLSVPDITESVVITNEAVSFVVGFADQSVALQLLAQSPINKRIDLYLALIDGVWSDHSLIGTPIWIYKGYIDTFTMVDNAEDGKSIISISTSSHWADFERKNGYRTNSRHQQSARYHPGDNGFKYCADNVKNLKWGALD